jgi:hypothetical protein
MSSHITFRVFVGVCWYLWLECFDFLGEVCVLSCIWSELYDMWEDRNAQWRVYISIEWACSIITVFVNEIRLLWFVSKWGFCKQCMGNMCVPCLMCTWNNDLTFWQKNIHFHPVVILTGKFQHGEHEGCVLGVLVFLLYINYLPFNINSVFTSLLFSDDTNIIVADPDVSHVAELPSHLFMIMNK